MFYNVNLEEEYMKMTTCLKEQNKEYQNLLNSKEYKLGSLILRIKNCISHFSFKSMLGYLRNLKWRKYERKTEQEQSFEAISIKPSEFFSQKKIAVYTCIFGDYDQIQEPLLQPNNIDYYIITDKRIDTKSAWNVIIPKFDLCEKLSNVEKNRYYKMHPDLILKDYDYSIYVDGNIKVISDLTPYIYKLNANGIGMHKHNKRNCSYDELEALLLAHKASKKDVIQYKRFLQENCFPPNYGLLECNVIVREHHNEICKKIMEQWWQQFETGIKRDQVSLPYVLHKNNIEVKDVAILGHNVYKNYDFRIVRHN